MKTQFTDAELRVVLRECNEIRVDVTGQSRDWFQPERPSAESPWQTVEDMGFDGSEFTLPVTLETPMVRMTTADDEDLFFRVSDMLEENAFDTDTNVLSVQDGDGSMCHLTFLRMVPMGKLSPMLGAPEDLRSDDQGLRNGVWFVNKFDELHRLLNLKTLGGYQARIEQVMDAVRKLAHLHNTMVAAFAGVIATPPVLKDEPKVVKKWHIMNSFGHVAGFIEADSSDPLAAWASSVNADVATLRRIGYAAVEIK